MARGSRFTLTRFALGGALASAFLLALAQPPFDLLPLPFLALVPLCLAFGSLPGGASGRWQATLLGLVFGLAFWGFELIWVPLEVGPFFPWAYPGFALLLVLLGGLSALLGWVAHFLHKEKAIPLGIAFPLAWVGVEWAKAHFPFGLAFPWLGLGVTLSGWPDLLGLAEWTGEAGVAFWLASVNALIAGMVLRREPRPLGREPRPKSREPLWGTAPWLLVGGAVLLPSVLGVVRARTIQLQSGPTAAVVGTLVPRQLRGTPHLAAQESVAQIQDALQGMESGTVDLVVLPEATIPFPMDAREASNAREALLGVALGLDAYVIVGALGPAGQDAAGEARTNSAYLLSPGTSTSQRYDKVRLVPGMEAGKYLRGDGAGTLRAGDWVLGLQLCYESLFGDQTREGRIAGSHVVVNLSSDIWFGHGDAFLGSFFLHQHPAHLVLRAVENRISVVRAANGGFSFLLDPMGHTLSARIPPSGGVATAQIPIFDGLTLFSRTGDWVGSGTALLCLLLVLAGAVARRGKNPRNPDSPTHGPGLN